MSWDSDTFLHVFDLSTNRIPTSVVSAYIPINSQMKSRYYAWNTASNTLANSNTTTLSDVGSSSVADGKDGQTVTVNLYDPSKTPIQLCKDIYYDHKNGNLIFRQDDGSIRVYTRPFASSSTYSDPTPQSYTSTAPMTSSPNSITTSGYYPMIVSHPNNRFAVYYVVNGANTILVVLANRGGSLSMVYSYFYQADGSRIMTKGQIMPPPGGDGGSGTGGNKKTEDKKDDKKTDISGNDLSSYYNWLAFWTTVAGASDKDAVFKASNYIPKSAVVPPVCPSCAYCSGGKCGDGVCANCGGQGGGGTSGQGGYRFADYVSNFGSGTKDLVQDSGSGVKDLLEDTGSGATNLVRDAASGTVGLAKDTVGGAVGLAKETVGGAVGLAKDTVGGAVGLVKDAGSGIAGVLKSHPMQISDRYNEYDRDGRGDRYNEYDRDGRGGPGTYTLPNEPLGRTGIDPYSYNGALVSKGGNYIPITSDFSAFGK
jgi:hypothetical protein